ncbi:MAG: hypothetical protein DRO23_00080 [Thermoprotei archaeon]|nr:MAG: hypothetical protein DRO23_00080 [Thermoprotei archaeon]
MVTLKFTTRAANDPAYVITVGLSRPLKDAFADMEKTKVNKIGRKLTKYLSYRVAGALIKNGYELPLPEGYLLRVRGEVTFDYNEEGGEINVSVKGAKLSIDIFKREKSISYSEGTLEHSIERSTAEK